MEAHTEKRKVAGEYRSTSQGAVAGGMPVNLWLPQASASPQRGGPLATLGGPWHGVAEVYQILRQGPGCKMSENITLKTITKYVSR